jgi:hypothetical protein
VTLAGVWLVEAGLPVLCESFLRLEVALVADSMESEVLKPCNLAEAKRCPNWPLWEQAIHEELNTLCTTSTWTLEQAPPGANHQLKMGLQGQEGCLRQGRMIQDAPCCAGIQPGGGGQLFQHLCACGLTPIITCCHCDGESISSASSCTRSTSRVQCIPQW